MTNDFEHNASSDVKTPRREKIAGVSRRRMMLYGGAGLAGVAAMTVGGRVDANTPQSAVAQQVSAKPEGRFAGKVVLITGATSGIGEATARAFAKEGAVVHFCGRREALGEKVAQEINAQGGKASYQKVDVCKEEEIKAFIDTCVQKYGRIDIAFNNAGVESSPNTVAEQSLEDWMNVMTTNATGTFLSMKYELPVMLKQGSGAIINNASVSSHVGFATIAPYSASKHAIASLTKVAALEYADKNIRINSISPGAVDTPMLRRAMAAWKLSEEQIANEYPLKRLVAPEEIAKTVLWLSSADPTCIIGTDIDVTGGYLTK
ncbi:SDR family oxidoreductase [Funiculus sociatus GB2-M2]|uniref:SDR family NAD(P)-dependent oxidoreductase n=1 Tax=Cyanophyceae TaxID=3028117 RepID=UPI001F559836|nr:SDR family oxidoreductase [Trichocoleus sp. FACHB-90]